jgi:hypothetical protein
MNKYDRADELIAEAIALGRVTEEEATHLRQLAIANPTEVRRLLHSTPIGARAQDERGRLFFEATGRVLASGKRQAEITADDIVRAGASIASEQAAENATARIDEMEMELRQRIATRAEEILREQGTGIGYSADEYLAALDQARSELAKAHSAL